MTAAPTPRQLMLAGEPYWPGCSELSAARRRARALLARFNGAAPEASEERLAVLRELLGAWGKGSILNPTLRCDYGFNVFVGDNCFFNFDCVLLDCNRIDIGDDVQVGPGVHIYTATHPLDAVQRRAGYETAQPVRIGSGVWLGGRAVVCPGVTIGENTVVGAGSVVVHDLPAHVLAVGNPCQVKRSLLL
jgi:maltose O-acetyltransferase